MTDEALTPEGAILAPDGSKVLFARAELADRESGAVVLHPGFADALAALRVALGRPMIVTSCCRSAARNRAVGGHPRSLHVYDHPAHGAEGTLAIDVRRQGPAYNRRLARLALELGWSLGVARSFFHLDRRDLVGLPPNVFGYGR